MKTIKGKSCKNLKKQMTVGFVHVIGGGIGDAVVALQAIYECKRFYNCKLIVFGSERMKQLLQYCSFVDEVVIVNSLTTESVLRIKEYACNYIILTNPKSRFIRDLKACNACVIVSLKFASLLSFKCKSVPLHLFPKYRKMNMCERLCRLVRKINPRIYDSMKQNMLEGGGIRIESKRTLLTKLTSRNSYAL